MTDFDREGRIDLLVREGSCPGEADLVLRRFVRVPGEDRLQEEVAQPVEFRPIGPAEAVGEATAVIEVESLMRFAEWVLTSGGA